MPHPRSKTARLLRHLIKTLAVTAALGIFMPSCAEKSAQIVVPVSGDWSMNLDAIRENTRLKLIDENRIDSALADAILSIPRAMFVTAAARHRAYDDRMLPIGSGQATLKLSDIAFILKNVRIRPTDNVLEIGTGTGFLAAVLSRISARVFSVEIIEYLGELARANLDRLNIPNAAIRIADGSRGWPAHAPYQVIVITAAVTQIPPEILEQLDTDGRIAAPILSENGRAQWFIYRNHCVAPSDNAGNPCALEEIGRKKTPVPPMI